MEGRMGSDLNNQHISAFPSAAGKIAGMRSVRDPERHYPRR
jgi:hypothetical protein